MSEMMLEHGVVLGIFVPRGRTKAAAKKFFERFDVRFRTGLGYIRSFCCHY